MSATDTATAVQPTGEQAADTSPQEESRDWYFTFGLSHVAPHGEDVYGKYVKIHGTYRDARDIMIAYFDSRWCGQYETAIDAGVHLFGLTELSLEDFTPLTPAEIAAIAEERRRKTYRRYL